MARGSLAPGDVLRGKYRLIRTLGRGGMGVVFAAEQLRTGQRVAIKAMRDGGAASSDARARFAREARAAATLRSEHVARILDVDDTDDGEPFLAMDLLEGKDLGAVLEDEGPLERGRAVGYVLQACVGLAEAHAAGIVHRDLKPANLFLTRRPDGTELVKILDFGISKAQPPENAADLVETREQTALGSPAYMSPEQLRDASRVDARTDVWSLGVALYQLLTGKLPFEAQTTAALAARIAADAPAPPGISGEIDEVVMRCLEKRPETRFASVAALAEALGPWTEGGAALAEQAARVSAAKRSDVSDVARDAARDERAPEVSEPGSAARVERATADLGARTATLTTHGTGAVAESLPEPAPPSPRRSASILVVPAVLVLAVVGLGLVSLRGAPTSTQAPPVPANTSPASDPPTPSAPSASASTSASTSTPTSSSTPPSRPKLRPSAPRPSPSGGKNPLEIDFR